MGINVLPRRFGKVTPGPTAVVVPGHPLTPEFFWIPNMCAPFGGGLIEGRGRLAPGAFTSGGAWEAASVAGYGGHVRKHTATSDRVTLGKTDTIVPQLNQVTILIALWKTDATLRATYDFTNITFGGAGVANVCGAAVPFSDGTVYWDWAGETNSAGGGRLTAPGLSFGNDVWCFTAGPRNQEIWQNGVLRASQSAVSAARGSAGDDFVFGDTGGGGTVSDFVRYGLFYVYWKQLTSKEIMDLTLDPFPFLEVR